MPYTIDIDDKQKRDITKTINKKTPAESTAGVFLFVT